MIPRAAGLCVHVSSLAGGHGIGNFGGARELIDWLAEAGFAVWQFLPLGPTGHGNSPYQLLSAFAGNPLFVDPDDLIGLGLLPRAAAGDVSAASNRIDYGEVIVRQRRRLEAAAATFASVTTTPLHREYAEFCERHGQAWLDDFVLYATLKREFGHSAWTAWEAEYRDRDPAALARWAERHRAALETERFTQFIWFRQWSSLRRYAAARGIAFFGDVPIYLPHDCADAWAERDLLDLDAAGNPVEVAGVPPDYFSAEGQRWGNPLYAWQRHAADGYRWWTGRLRHAFAKLDMVRLDHFRGFEAYWAIPADRPARDGCWRPGPGAAFFAAIRQALGDCSIIAEDLGVITDAVTALRRQFAMPGMQVLQFMIGEDAFDPCAIEEDCVCYTGTHDNDTTVGWFHRSARQDPGELHKLQEVVCARLRCGPDGIAHRLIDVAFRTRAALAVVPVQDVLGLDSAARMNTPGTVGDNWSWRLLPGQLDETSAAQMRAMIDASGRMARRDDKDGQG